MLNKPYQEKESKVALHESRGIKVCSKNINRQYVIEEGSIITSMGTKVRGQQPVINLKLLKNIFHIPRLAAGRSKFLKVRAAERRLHLQIRPERCLFQSFSASKLSEISLDCLVCEGLCVRMTLFWLWPVKNIY